MKRSIKFVAGFLILFFLYHFAEYFVLFQYKPWLFLAIQLQFFFGAWIIARWQGFRGIAMWGLATNTAWVKQILSGVLLGSLLYFVTFVICLAFGVEALVSIPAVPEMLPEFFLFCFGVFFSSLSEDILTRGYLYGHFGNRLSPVTFVLISATVFLLNHIYRLGEGWETLIYILILGVLLAIPLVVTKYLWLTTGIHWAGNSVFFLTHSVFETETRIDNPSPNTIFIICMLVFIPLVLLIARHFSSKPGSAFHLPRF